MKLPSPDHPRHFAATASTELYVELLRLHARALRRMPWVQSLLVLGVTVLVAPAVPIWECLAWGAVTIGIEVIRAFYAARLLHTGHSFDPRRAHIQFVALAGAAGLSIGFAGVFFLSHLSVFDRALLGVILYAMPAAGVAVSQSSRYMIGAYAAMIFVPADAAWIVLQPSQLVPVSGLAIVYWGYLVMVAADGEHLLGRSIQIRHERDRLVQDLEKKNLEVQEAVERAEKSAQVRARVLAAASHDLRQPLHALSIYSAVLSAGPPAHTVQELASSIDQIVRSLGSLLHGLLDLSSLATGHFVPQLRRVLLDKVVAAVCVEYEGAAMEKGLRLSQQLQPVGVVSDPVVLGRIVRNLLDNAIKYTDEGTISVEVRLEKTTDRSAAVLSVADTGRGIPSSEHARIFEEFYQLDNPGRDRTKGVGLGLAIVQRLCEALGTKIHLSSEQEKGSIFSVSLPSVFDPSEFSSSSGGQTGFDLLVGRRVYVVDDEIDIVRSMTYLLSIWGAQVQAPNSIDTIDHLFVSQGAPDLLITDLRLGDFENGVVLANRMRERYGAFPVVIITGDVGTVSRADIQAHPLTVAFKPITAEGLQAAIRAAFSTANHTPSP